MDKIDEKSILITITITIFSFLILVWNYIKQKRKGGNDVREDR